LFRSFSGRFPGLWARVSSSGQAFAPAAVHTPSLPRSCRTAFTTPAAQVFQVEKGDRPAAGELRERAVPALDRLVLDEERREGLLQELVRLGLRLGLEHRRLCVPLGLGDLRLREGLDRKSTRL